MFTDNSGLTNYKRVSPLRISNHQLEFPMYTSLSDMFFSQFAMRPLVQQLFVNLDNIGSGIIVCNANDS